MRHMAALTHFDEINPGNQKIGIFQISSQPDIDWCVFRRIFSDADDFRCGFIAVSATGKQSVIVFQITTSNPDIIVLSDQHAFQLFGKGGLSGC